MNGPAGWPGDIPAPRLCLFVKPSGAGANPRVLEFRAGFIPTTLDQSGPDRISFMHVDLNGAVATRHALESACPRWWLGGILLAG